MAQMRMRLYNDLMTVLISRHVQSEGPAYFADFLDRHGIPYTIIKIDQDEALPKRITGLSGLVFMGGPMSVNDDLPWIPQALTLIRQAIESDIPVLGHCLGGQLISKALGGTVAPNRVREIGWFPARVVDGPLAETWFEGLDPEFEVYHWHGETFTVPPGATRILASAACENQAFAIGKTLGLQCHVEMTADLVREWARVGAREIAEPSASVQNAAQMLHELEARVERLHRVADVVYARWIRNLA
jgi:GMP synthase-like glutamine amidotransferase